MSDDLTPPHWDELPENVAPAWRDLAPDAPETVRAELKGNNND